MIMVTSIQFYSFQIVENDEDNIENRQASRTSQDRSSCRSKIPF
jgi:hypothetical protein